ncbi:MAG TPA: Gfo/Idh/MocA family oxidoreductase [Fimbriimonas sp.]|nr:Gfo/Idh/MocA family oxidoreductase [Fimbriimonas sp.]
MKTVRYGILGCGNISRTHAQGIQGSEGAELVAVCDVVPDKASKLGQELGVPSFDKFEELLAEVDALTIALPSGDHVEYTIRAAQAGKHILSEKPLAITVASGLEMVEACEREGVKLGCVSQHRFTRDMLRLYNAAQSGELGKLLQGDSYTKWYRSQGYYDSAGWRGTWAMDGGGCLMNQGVHYVDMIQWIMGGVKSVRGMAKTAMHNIEVEDQAIAMVEYNNGAIGVIQGSTCSYPGLTERLEVHGTLGQVVIEGDRAKIWTTKALDQHEAFGALQPIGVAHDLEPDPTTSQWNEAHRLQIQDFTNAILEDRDPMITGRAALEPVKVILAIYESSRRGGELVELAELK